MPRFLPPITRPLILFLLLGISGCASVLQPPNGPPLWRLQQGQETLWLFGTIHRLPDYTRLDRIAARNRGQATRLQRLPIMPWRTIPVRRAMLASDRLLLELVPAADQDLITAVVQELVRYRDAHPIAAKHTDGHTDHTSADTGTQSTQPLKAFLSQQEQQSVAAAATRRGIDESLLQQADPLLVFALFANTQPNTYGTFEPGADFWLLLEAQQRDIPIAGLETLNDRIAALYAVIAQLRGAEQAQIFLRYLETELAEVAVNDPEYQELIELWQSGNTTVLSQRMERYAAALPAIHEAFIATRNRHWRDRIVSLLGNGENEFVAVGLGHLLGPDNLVELLQEAGYTLERVQ